MSRALEITGTLPGGATPALHAWVGAGATLRWTRDPAAIAGRPCASGASALLGPPSTAAGEPLVVGAATDAPGWMVHVPAGANLLDAGGACLGVGPLTARLTRGGVRLLLDDYAYDVRVVEAAPHVAAPRRAGVREVAALVGLLAPAAAAVAGHAAPPAEEQGIDALLVELAVAEGAMERAAERAADAQPREAAPIPLAKPPSAELPDIRLPAPPEDARATLNVEEVLVAEGVRIEVPATPGCAVGGDGPVCMPWDLLADVEGWLEDDSLPWGHAGVPVTKPLLFDGEAARMLAEALRSSLPTWDGVSWSARVHAPRVAGALSEVGVARPLGAIARSVAWCDRVRWDAWVVHVEASVDAAGAVTHATVEEAGDAARSDARAACIARVVREASFAPSPRYGVPPVPIGGPSVVRFTLAGRWR